MSYDQFAYDRDMRGRPAEYLLVSYFLARGIFASINDAPEEDRAGRASHDIVVAGELWDVKTDFVAATSKRIFIERASLEHTHSSRFAYLIPTPYGFDIRIFPTIDLVAMYNEPSEVNRGDGTTFQLFKYKHAVAGDQANNEGFFIPMDVVKQVAHAPWQVLQEIRQLRQAA